MSATFPAVMEVVALALLVISGLANLFGVAHADTTVLWVVAIYFHLRRREAETRSPQTPPHTEGE